MAKRGKQAKSTDASQGQSKDILMTVNFLGHGANRASSDPTCIITWFFLPLAL